MVAHLYFQITNSSTYYSAKINQPNNTQLQTRSKPQFLYV